MGVVHICNHRAEQEPEAVQGEECAAQHDGRYTALDQDKRPMCDKTTLFWLVEAQS